MDLKQGQVGPVSYDVAFEDNKLKVSETYAGDIAKETFSAELEIGAVLDAVDKAAPNSIVKAAVYFLKHALGL